MGSHDELSQIPGIGPARARWLEETFGVRGIRDLAALSPDEIEAGLRAEGRVSRRSIESWVAEARARTRKKRKAKQPTTAAGNDSSRRRRGDAPEWEPAASFVIEFQSRKVAGGALAWQTAAHHLEQDLNETWTGIDCSGLCRWMTEQLRGANEAAAHEAGLALPEEGGGAAPTQERKRIALRAHVVNSNGGRLANLLQINKPWAVVFTWSLDPPTPAPSGEWIFDVLLAPLGPGEPVRAREGPLRLRPSRHRANDYRYRLEVPAGTISSSRVETTYRGRAMITYRSQEEGRVLVAGLGELGLLRFFRNV
jgi:hypothetical protein